MEAGKRRYLRGCDKVAERTEGVIKCFLINHGVKVADEKFRANFNRLLLVCRCL